MTLCKYATALLQVEGDWETPCEVCGRTYAHTHVRALYSTQHRSDADSDEGSGD